MSFIFLDLECTCWREDQNSERMEIIEIGAVRLDDRFEPVDDFNAFVRPVVEPILSEFCTRLTSIEQADVDAAGIFPAVFDDFRRWAGEEPFRWFSWGAFDYQQIGRDLRRHGLAWPGELAHYGNLKGIFARWAGLAQPIGMRRALRRLELPFNGRHHRAIDDARQTAAIGRVIYQAAGLPVFLEDGRAVPT